MKATRRQLYDSTDVDFYQKKNPMQKGPTRSVTVSDFQSPSIYSNTEDGEEEEWYNEEEWEEEEEEYYDDHRQIDKFFRELSKKYDYSQCNEKSMIRAYRRCDYELDTFLESALSGDFGHFIAKDALIKPKAEIKPPTPKKEDKPQQAAAPKQSTATQHSKTAITVDQADAAISSQKPYYNLVIVGHVDAGKSTLMGHLLYLAGKISDMDQIKDDSRKAGKGTELFAWAMTDDESERSHGVTIDVSMKEFETEHRHITILDAPGHRDFVPNMIAGASQADNALLVVDSSNPLIDRGQAREHLIVCRALGVSNIVVAVNKMDSVSFDKSAFDDVRTRLTTFLKGLGWANVTFIPTAAVIGCNINAPAPETPWYTGPTIVQALDQIPTSAPDISSQFLMSVSESIDASNTTVVISGRIESGYVCPGDTILILPANETAKVSNVKIEGVSVPFGPAGRIAEVAIQTQLGTDVITVGSAILDPKRTLHVATQFVARVSTFQMRTPMLKGAVLVFHRHAVDTVIKVQEIKAIINKKTKQVEKKDPTFVPSNSIADVVFRLNSPLVLETQSQSKSFGRFIFREKGETLGFGAISEIITMNV